MAAFDEISKGIKEAFNAATPELFPGTTLELLEVDDDTNDFTVIENLTADWFLDTSKQTIEIAKDDSFGDTIKRATDARIYGTIYHFIKGSAVAPIGGYPWVISYGEPFERAFRKY